MSTFFGIESNYLYCIDFTNFYQVKASTQQLTAVTKNEKFSLSLKKKFRQMNSLVISFIKTLFSRNFCEKV